MPTSCDAFAGTADGAFQTIYINQKPVIVRCFFDGKASIDTFEVSGGSTTRRNTDANSCPSGMDIWVPRTQTILSKVFAAYGNKARAVGVYGGANGCGSCTSKAMNSGTAQASHWHSVGREGGGGDAPWFLRSVPYGEPNGDYTSGCWLYVHGSTDGNGALFNDWWCKYGFTDYVCSTNQWSGGTAATAAARATLLGAPVPPPPPAPPPLPAPRSPAPLAPPPPPPPTKEAEDQEIANEVAAEKEEAAARDAAAKAAAERAAADKAAAARVMERETVRAEAEAEADAYLKSKAGAEAAEVEAAAARAALASARRQQLASSPPPPSPSPPSPHPPAPPHPHPPPPVITATFLGAEAPPPAVPAPRPCHAPSPPAAPVSPRLVVCKFTVDSIVDEVYLNGAALEVVTANRSDWRVVKTVSFEAPEGYAQNVLAIHGHAPRWRKEGGPPSGEDFAGGGLLLACRSEVGGWRSLLSSERSPRARVLANDDGAAPPAGWADAVFDDGEWDLPALGKGAKGLAVPSAG